MRRVIRAPPAGAPKFKLDLAPAEVQELTVKPTPALSEDSVGSPGPAAPPPKARTIIQLDDSMVSPLIATGFHTDLSSFDSSARTSPTVSGAAYPSPGALGMSASASPPTLPEAPAAPAPKGQFYKVDKSNVYVFVEGAPLMREDGVASTMRDFVANADSDMLGGVVAGSNRLSGRPVIHLDQLERLHLAGRGQQGEVFACRHAGTMYALKSFSMRSIHDAPTESDRHARKAAVVRELQMVARDTAACPHLVTLHNAYVQDEALMVLMEWMGRSVEDVARAASRMRDEDVKALAKQTLGKGYGGDMTIRTKDAVYEQSRAVERAQVIRGTGLPEVVAATIVADVLRGLHYLHSSLRIVHTDLKPANILLSPDLRESKISDFGCSMRLGEDGKVRFKGVTLGTKLYMPPDRVQNLMFSNDAIGSGTSFQSTIPHTPATIAAFAESLAEASDESFDEKCDVWSVGILLLELVTGCHPCQALIRDNYWNYASNLRLQNMIKPKRCSDLLYNVVKACLNPNPKLRPAAVDILQMPFFRKYEKTDRKRFAMFVDRLSNESKEYEQRRNREELKQILERSMLSNTSTDYHAKESQKKWRDRNIGLGIPPKLSDTNIFPPLGS